MKVYILFDYEEDIIDVFSSRERAEEAAEVIMEEWGVKLDFTIEEYEVVE